MKSRLKKTPALFYNITTTHNSWYPKTSVQISMIIPKFVCYITVHSIFWGLNAVKEITWRMLYLEDAWFNGTISLITTDPRAYSLWRRQSSQASIWQRLQDSIYLRCLVPHISQTLPRRDPSSLVNLPLCSHSWFICSSRAIATTRCWRIAGSKGHGASLLTTC